MTAGVVISFRPPADRISANDRIHHHVRARLTAIWRTAAHAAALAQHIGALPEPAVHACHVVRIEIPVRDRRRRDPANLAPTVKAIVDGLTDAKLWPDDSSRWVRTTEPTFAVGAKEVVVRIAPGLRMDLPLGKAWADITTQLESLAAGTPCDS